MIYKPVFELQKHYFDDVALVNTVVVGAALSRDWNNTLVTSKDLVARPSKSNNTLVTQFIVTHLSPFLGHHHSFVTPTYSGHRDSGHSFRGGAPLAYRDSGHPFPCVFAQTKP